MAACRSLELNGLVQDEAGADGADTVLAKWALHVGLQAKETAQGTAVVSKTSGPAIMTGLILKTQLLLTC